MRSRRPSIPYMICSEPSSCRLEVRDELHELVGFRVEVEEVERLQGEGRVADPGVAVVPVALASGRLRQGRRERGDGCPGGHIRQALDRERRALDRIAQAVVGDPRPAQPGAPEAGRGCRPAPRPPCCRRARPAPRPMRGRSTPFRPPGGRGAPRTRSPSMSSARSEPAGWSARRRSPRRSGGRHPPSSRRRGAPVVERRLADDLELDLSLEALDRPHEHVVGIVVRGRARVRRDLVLVIPGADRQSVKDDAPSRTASSRSSEDIRPGLVRARGRMVDPERRRSGRSRPVGRGGCRRRSVSRRTGCRASRSRRPGPRARRCGSRTGTRSRRSAETATVRRRSAASPWRSRGAHDAIHGPCQRP